eukprot:gene11491-34207_t
MPAYEQLNLGAAYTLAAAFIAAPSSYTPSPSPCMDQHDKTFVSSPSPLSFLVMPAQEEPNPGAAYTLAASFIACFFFLYSFAISMHGPAR